MATSDETVAIIHASGDECSHAYPGFDHPTLIDELDAKRIRWHCYTTDVGIAKSIRTGPSAIQHLYRPLARNGVLVCTGVDWKNVITTKAQIINDVANNVILVNAIVLAFEFGKRRIVAE